MEDKVSGCTTNEEAAKFIEEFEEIIMNKKSDIVWLVYYQGQIFQKLKEKESFVSMVLKLNVSKSTIIFKIASKKLIDNFPKIKDSCCLFIIFKKTQKRSRKFARKTLASLNR